MRRAPNVSEHRRRRVLAAAEELGYRPNALARSLASNKTNTIGVVVNDLHNPYFAEVADGIQDAADDAGFRLMFGNGRHSDAGEAAAVDTFLDFRVDGLIVAGVLRIESIERAAATVPMVVVARTEELEFADTVNTDDTAGAALVVDHLVALGHRRIAHIDGGGGAGAAQRSAGYVDAMTRYGLGDEVSVVEGDFDETSGRAAASRLFDTDAPTAIFAGNDLSAIGAFDHLHERGRRVPDDVSLVGYDNIALSAMAHLDLTTVNQPTHDIGSTAFGLLVERIDGRRTDPVHIERTPELVVRGSTAPPPTTRSSHAGGDPS